MSALLPTLKLDSSLPRHFLPYQVDWIEAEDTIHAAGKQAFAFAEKSVRIGWTYADAFKNVRKRLRFKKRDYLFATKDWPIHRNGLLVRTYQTHFDPTGRSV